MVMTKKDLISRLRDSESMTWEQATRVVDTVFGEITDEVVKGNDVYIPKFGRFYRTHVADKRCRHPVTKEEIITPAHGVIRLRMAEELKRRLGGKA